MSQSRQTCETAMVVMVVEVQEGDFQIIGLGLSTLCLGAVLIASFRLNPYLNPFYDL